MGKGQFFSYMELGKLKTHVSKKKKKNRLDDYLTIYTKLNSKFKKDLRITPEAIKVLKRNIDGKLLDIGIDAQCRGNKSKLNKWKHIIKVLVAQSCSTL